MAGEHIAYIGAFTAGFLTFLSPCILPLIPSFIAYIAGVSYGDMKDGPADVRIKTISHTISFIIGFSIVFILMGLTATALGKALFAYQKYIRIGGGALIILFGLTLAGILKIGFLEKGFHIRPRGGKATYFGSFLVGVTFAAAWTPCAGPFLGSILVIAGTEGNAVEGAKLLALYSAGIGLPFLITAVAMQMFLVYFNRFKNAVAYVNKAAGAILILAGTLIITDSLNIIAQKVTNIFGIEASSVAPDISLRDMDGNKVQLSDFKGKVIILDFFATWCPPCREEMPSMDAMYKKFKGTDLVMLPVSIDENAETIREFMKKNNYAMPAYHDANRDAGSVYGITGVPETFLIDRKNIIAEKFIGPIDWAKPDVLQAIQNLMK